MPAKIPPAITITQEPPITAAATASKSTPVAAKNKEVFQQCKNCLNVIVGGETDSAKTLAEHMKTCLSVERHTCSICFKIFTHKRGLNNHLRITHLVFD